MTTSHQLSRSTHNSLPGADDITRVELPNGITVLTRPNFNSPSVVFTGYLETGGLFDPQAACGQPSPSK